MIWAIASMQAGCPLRSALSTGTVRPELPAAVPLSLSAMALESSRGVMTGFQSFTWSGASRRANPQPSANAMACPSRGCGMSSQMRSSSSSVTLAIRWFGSCTMVRHALDWECFSIHSIWPFAASCSGVMGSRSGRTSAAAARLTGLIAASCADATSSR